jgi:hypothetical protein
MALAEPRERLHRRLVPFVRHPGEMRHDARPQVGTLGLLRGHFSEPAERPFYVSECDVLALPLLHVLGRGVQCRSHSLPSRRMSSSAAAGPQVPAA